MRLIAEKVDALIFGARLRGKAGFRVNLAVMAGLDPAIQAPHSLDEPLAFNEAQFLDCRVNPGNDGARGAYLSAYGVKPGNDGRARSLT